MRRYLNYAIYICRHKWFVFWEAMRLGIPFLGLIHDLHKFLPDEFIPYARFFYNSDGSNKQVRDKTGYYKPDDTGDSSFDRAWFLHQKRAWHHWQSWCFPDSNGKLKTLPIPNRYRREMLADWRGAARAQGLNRDSVPKWFTANKDKMILHHDTETWLAEELGLPPTRTGRGGRTIEPHP